MHTDSATQLREELVNSLTHGFGLLLSAIGCPVLVWLALQHGGLWNVVSSGVYGSTLVLLFASSTLYHSCRRPAVKHILRLCDHSAIYLLIAGTYTPFTLVTLHGPWGWSLFAVVWALCFLGIADRAKRARRGPNVSAEAHVASPRSLSPALYIVMGWMAVVAIKPLLALLTWHGLAWLLAGGMAYTFGLVFFAWETFPYNHAIWHLFVMAGSACHYVAVLTAVVWRH